MSDPALSFDHMVPEWATGWGEDRCGVYADFELNRVTQRMRWIVAGSFKMGSTKTELDRDDDELEHEVVLSSGFWLADTACTQGLWQAVMGDNPSHFQGAQKPVEQVSWEDCQRFFERAEELSPGLQLRVPTEAQWEYACRAGTTTPFSFGATITPDQVNYDGNYPYGRAKKGLCRGQTELVKKLPSNAWGLYGMHGNVWEWCADWYGHYAEGTAIDPLGPDAYVAADSGKRIVRGGSWFGSARLTRSAKRYAKAPGEGERHLGLRLSLDPTRAESNAAYGCIGSTAERGRPSR